MSWESFLTKMKWLSGIETALAKTLWVYRRDPIMRTICSGSNHGEVNFFFFFFFFFQGEARGRSVVLLYTYTTESSFN